MRKLTPHRAPNSPPNKIAAAARFLWDAITSLIGSVWFVACDRCGLHFGAVEPGLRGQEFRTREEANDAARYDGWLIERKRMLCPACRREQEPA